MERKRSQIDWERERIEMFGKFRVFLGKIPKMATFLVNII